MTTYDIANKWRQIGIQREPIYFDSAEPRLIEELKRMGFNVRPSLKGSDSINAGIDLLKRFKLHIHEDSHNCLQEFRNYKWQEDRSGKLLNKPIDKNDHTIDSVRYATYSVLSKPKFGKYTIV